MNTFNCILFPIRFGMGEFNGIRLESGCFTYLIKECLIAHDVPAARLQKYAVYTGFIHLTVKIEVSLTFI